MAKDVKKKAKAFIGHLFKLGGMQYGLFKGGKPYDVSKASQMLNYHRKKLGMDDDAEVSLPQFRKTLRNTFKIDIKSVPDSSKEDAHDKAYQELIDKESEELEEDDK